MPMSGGRFAIRLDSLAPLQASRSLGIDVLRAQLDPRTCGKRAARAVEQTLRESGVPSLLRDDPAQDVCDVLEPRRRRLANALVPPMVIVGQLPMVWVVEHSKALVRAC